jgi:alpha-beta hydrolase superfamily lysophospholipase
MIHDSSDCRPLTFRADGLRLHGVLHLPANPTPPLAVGCHGLFSSGDSAKQIALARLCNAKGIAFLRFDHRGCGQSQADPAHGHTLAGRCRDLSAAVAAVRATGLTRPDLGLFGSSLGGTVCLASWAALRPAAIITLAAPLVTWTPEPQPVPPGLVFDLSTVIGGVHSLLVVHGTADETVPPDHARRIYELAAAPKQLLWLPGSDHRISRPDHLANLLTAATAWFRRFLPGAGDHAHDD